MFPTSNVRAYINENLSKNDILTRDKATSISKTMAKFYKKPKVIPTLVPELDQNPKLKPEPVIPISSKKDKKYKKDIQQKEEPFEVEELNYVGDKDDLKNLDFLFREATGYETGDDKDKSSDSASDRDEMDKVEKREKREKSHKYQNHDKVTYPFSHKYSLHFSQDYKDEYYDGSDILVEFLIYRVNKEAYHPFIEFMLYKADKTFYLPNLVCRNSASGSDIGSGGDNSDHDFESQNIYDKVVSTLDAIFTDGKYKIKGRLIPSKYMNCVDETYLSERYILFVESTSYNTDEDNSEDDTRNNTSTHYIPEETKLWWVTISEIFNYKKVLFFPVHDSVVNLFYSYPEMMSIFIGDKLLEIPIVVYNGNNDKYTKYNAIFSLKKSSQFSRYGPFYYFTDFHSSFKYACYDVDDGGDMQKFKKGGLLRTIIFPQKIKMFLERDKIDDSMMAQYLFEKNPEKINTGQFRDNDNKWVKRYNTAYNGEYMITYDRDKYVEKDEDEKDEDEEDEENEDLQNGENDDKNIKNSHRIKEIPFPVMFCVSEYNQQKVLSYHYVDTENIPDKYNYKFKDYKLL
jgi:hypothetical protein